MRVHRTRMVEWFSPTLLLKAAVEVIVSKLFGQHADQRTVQSLLTTSKMFDYSSGTRVEVDLNNHVSQTQELSQAVGSSNKGEPQKNDIWIDYISDVGDGWNSTYSIAWLAAQPKLELIESQDAQKYVTEKGRLLLFGGDEVYPLAKREEYDRRLLAPYREAFGSQSSDKPVDVFAIPGNHDWYDSLRSFGRIFFTSTPFADIANTSTPQSRSYFSIKLGFGWWILGTDVQLGSDIDASQYEYFKLVSKHFEPSDRVILCTAEPHWLRSKRTQYKESVTGETALDRLERELLGDRVALFIAGDVHHYMRFQSQTSVHKITAGGGGAFLHPTHRSWETKLIAPTNVPPLQDDKNEFHRPKNAIYPPAHVSWRLCWRNLFFAYLNPRFGIFTGTLYVILTLVMLPAFDEYNKRRNQDHAEKVASEYRRLVDEMRSNLQKLKSTTIIEPSLSKKISDMESAVNELPLTLNKSINSNTKSWVPNKLLLEKWRSDFKQYQVTNESNHDNIDFSVQQKTFENTIKSLNENWEEVFKLDMTVLNPKSSGYFDRAKIAMEQVINTTATEHQSSPESSNKSIKVDHLKVEQRNESVDTNPQQPLAKPILGPWYFLYALTKQELRLPRPFESLLAILVFAIMFGGFIAFTAIPRLAGRILLGMTHGMAHWLGAYLLTYTLGIVAVIQLYEPELIVAIMAVFILAIAIRLAATGEDGLSLKRLAMAFLGATIYLAVIYLSLVNELPSLSLVLLVFLGGWIIGSTIMGSYLFLTHSITGQHWNEAFSAIHCEDWKCFVRFKLSPNGELTIFPIGLPKVCKKWREEINCVKPLTELKPILIEKPIIVLGKCITGK